MVFLFQSKWTRVEKCNKIIKHANVTNCRLEAGLMKQYFINFNFDSRMKILFLKLEPEYWNNPALTVSWIDGGKCCYSNESWTDEKSLY